MKALTSQMSPSTLTVPYKGSEKELRKYWSIRNSSQSVDLSSVETGEHTAGDMELDKVVQNRAPRCSSWEGLDATYPFKDWDVSVSCWYHHLDDGSELSHWASTRAVSEAVCIAAACTAALSCKRTWECQHFKPDLKVKQMEPLSKRCGMISKKRREYDPLIKK